MGTTNSKASREKDSEGIVTLLREADVKLIKDLVSIRSFTGDEEEVQKFISEWLTEKGIEFVKIPVGERRWNILALFGKGSPLMLFSGHSDTVPQEGAFPEPKVEHSKLYGIGSTDMKAGLGIMLNRLVNAKLNGTIGMLVTVGEEKGDFDGMESAIKYGPLREFKTAFISEPTNLDVVNEQFGLAGINMTTKGIQRHTSEFAKDGQCVHEIIHALDTLIKSWNRRRMDSILSVNFLKGGFKENIVPGEATAKLDVRVSPRDTLKKIDEFFTNELKDVEWEKRKWIEPVRDPDATFATWLRNTTGAGKVASMKGFTEIYFLNKIGIKAVSFGPGLIELAHKEGEYVPIENIYSYGDMISRLLRTLNGGSNGR